MIQSDLAQIIAQARSLSERLSNRGFKLEAAQVSEQQISDDRLAHWCQVVAQGNWEKFQKRLRWDGLDIDAVRPVLGALPLADSQVLPTWAETLREIIQTASELVFQEEATDPSQISNPKSCLDPENPLPFEDVLLPIVLVARQQLLTQLRSPSLSPGYLPLELLSEEAYLTLERSLLQRLMKLCAKTLEFEFSHFRPFGQTLLSLLGGETKGTHSKVRYNAFVQKLLQDGLLAFFQNYPVLGRLMATAIDFWVEATAEFLQRMKADLSEIQQVFNHSTEKGNEVSKTQLGKVTEIKPSLSDPHNRGRSVLALTFESGLKLIYKPKDLGLEVAFNQFLSWCNQHGVPLTFKVLKVLNRQGYGWVEYVDHLPCEDEAAAQRFYERAGILLCLLYALGGTDCHYENLISSGEHLVLIDLETLMHHEANPMSDSPEAVEAETTINQQVWDSVLCSGLLPRWEFTQDYRIAYDVSGLGSVDPQQVPRRVPQWKYINTDNMRLAHEKVALPVQANVPILNGIALSPNDYLNELVVGFQQMYHFLIQQREVLLAGGGPLAALNHQQVRFVFRGTKVYGVILEKSLAPQFLHNGADRSIELDILSRAFLTTHDKSKAWSILQAELRAVEQLDVPYFSVSSDSDTLTAQLEQPIEKYFKEPSKSNVISRLQKLNETDLAQQVAIIQGAFYARVAQTRRIGKPEVPNSLAHLAADLSQRSLLTSKQLLQKAQVIAQQIQERAINAMDGSLNWIGLAYVPNADRFQIQVLGDNLYDGSCGIALFLAALDHVMGNTQFRDLALGALRSLRRVLQTSDAEFIQRFVRRIGIGGTMGLGSIIYSLVRMSHFLQNAVLLEDAQRAANLITPELIAADRKFDVMAGAAGAILGLLTLYTETGELAVLDKAVTCGQHLLAHRISVDNSPRAWRTLEEKPLTGFSHGAAGIAYALLRLYAVTHDRAYLEAAEEGITYERSVFSPAAANWPDFRDSGGQNGQFGFVVNWCHGAPGIGLARLGGLSILETDEIRQDVEVALQTTQKYGLQGLDHLCCGNFGRIEALLVAGQKLSRPDLLKTAQKRATWAVAQADKIGEYQLFNNLSNPVFSPSFFQGTAGIGYELLRLAYPEALPSVLLWE
ncbi:type 2 lanthipeptide synthetase LanM family protein [Coleofasciculus sp. E1-EBD-02]|uniref:type 2 lanthipeptide synthetase LanM family protein n=1 Tax=Coleofasciculus sp. E1-EBD-02 TaxID=3068481 RepID=UPI0032F2AE58